jgi:hypothetical protein
MRLVLSFIKKKYPKYYSRTTIKSVSQRVNRFSKHPEALQLRVRKFLRVLLLPFFVLKALKKTNASIAVIDNFIGKDRKDFRLDFIKYFKPNYQEKDFAFLDGKSYYYQHLTFSNVISAAVIWLEWLLISLLAIIRPKDNYSLIYFDNIASNLINLTLIQPKESYVFHFYSPTAYLTTLIGQANFEMFISASSSLLYTGSRYGTLPDATMLFCWDYHFEEYNFFSKLGWLETKQNILWGPEEIEEHSQIIPQPHQYDVGIYSRGDWARDEFLNRVTDIEYLRSGQHSENEHAQFFRKIIETLGEMTPNLRMKIYPHPFEREYYKKYNVKPAYSDLAEQYGIEIDLSEGNSIDKIYECRVGIGNITSIIMDRWGHGLKAFAAYNEVLDKNFCAPQYLGKYEKCFFSSTNDLRKLVEEEVL